MENGNFWKTKAWESIVSDLAEIKDSQKTLERRVNDLDKKVSRIIGYASGVGAMAGLVVAFVKDVFTKNG